jgi:hypothetical protein
MRAGTVIFAACLILLEGCGGQKQVCECAVYGGGTTPETAEEEARRSDAVTRCLERHGGGTVRGCPMPASAQDGPEPPDEIESELEPPAANAASDAVTCPDGTEVAFQCSLDATPNDAVAVCFRAAAGDGDGGTIDVRVSAGSTQLATEVDRAAAELWLYTSPHMYGAALIFEVEEVRYAVFSSAEEDETDRGVRRLGSNEKTWPCRGEVLDEMYRLETVDVPLRRQEYPF